MKVIMVQCCFEPHWLSLYEQKAVRWWWSILLLAVLGMRGRGGQGKSWRDVATAGRLSLLMIRSGALQRYRRLDIIQRAEQRQESVSVGFLHRSEINSAVGRCPWSRISEMQTPTSIRDVLLKDDVFPFPVGIILAWMRMNDEQQEYQSMSRALSHNYFWVLSQGLWGDWAGPLIPGFAVGGSIKRVIAIYKTQNREWEFIYGAEVITGLASGLPDLSFCLSASIVSFAFLDSWTCKNET